MSSKDLSLLNNIGLVFVLYTLYNRKSIVKSIDKKFKIDRKSKKFNISLLIYLLPVVLLSAYDYYADTVLKISWTRGVGITKLIPNEVFNYILRLAGAYGIILPFAESIGIKSGLIQRNLFKNVFFQCVMFVSAAYSLTGHRSEAIMATLFYYVLKYHVSGGKYADL